MPVPKRKRSKSRRDKRFANKGIKKCAITACAHCSSALAPHIACAVCGHYKGIKVINTKTEREMRRDKERKTKEQREKGGAVSQEK
jgi:large subunit ribosomal protein L32